MCFQIICVYCIIIYIFISGTQCWIVDTVSFPAGVLAVAYRVNTNEYARFPRSHITVCLAIISRVHL